MAGQTTGGLALTLAGGLIGTIIAPGIGTSIGLALGGLVGSIAFPADPILTEGPRLGDLDVTSSAPGLPRPIGYGTMRIAGNIIWALDINEVATEEEIGGGGLFGLGPPAAINITYTYYGNFAVAFGEGPAVDVFRIWMNNRLVYDQSKKNRIEANFDFRFYPGDDEQTADGLIAEDRPGRTPGFRNTVYIVFEELLLTNYGNRLPQVQAEIVYNRTIDPQTDLLKFKNGIFDSFQSSWANYSPSQGMLWTGDGTGDPQGLRIFDVDQLEEVREVDENRVLANAAEDEDQPNNGIHFGMPPCLFRDGGAVIQTNTTGTTNSKVVSRLNETGVETDRFPLPPYESKGAGFWSSIRGTTQTVPSSDFCTELIAVHPEYGPRSYAVLVNLFGDSVSVLQYPSMGYVYDSESDDNVELLPRGLFARPKGWCVKPLPPIDLQLEFGGAETLYWTQGYSISGQSTFAIHSVTVGFGAQYVPGSGGAGDSYFGVSIGTVLIPASKAFPGDSTLFEFGTNLVWDQTDGTLIFTIRRENLDIHLVKFTTGGNRVWISDPLPASAGTFSFQFGNSVLKNGFYGAMYGDNAYIINTSNGEFEFLDASVEWPQSSFWNGVGVFDSRNMSILGLNDTTGEFTIWYLGRYTAGGTTVGTIVRDVATRLDIADADLDTTDIDPIPIPGYMISRQMSGRNAILPLQHFYFFDGVETDWMLKFVLRGNSPIRTIGQSELAFINPGQTAEFIKETRKQEVELPERFNTTFMNVDNDYLQETQSSKRILNPAPAMYSLDQQSLEIMAALEPDEVKQQTEKALFTAWEERKGFEFKLSWEHIDLDPTDVITLNLDSASIRSRISTFDVVEGFSIEVSSIAEQQNQFITSGITSYSGEGTPIQTVRSSFDVIGLLVDAPHLSDDDEPEDRALIPNYWYAGGKAPGTFEFAALFASDDNITYSNISRLSREMTWGHTINALGDPPDDNPYVTDRVNTLTISVRNGFGNFQSISEAQMLDGANRLFVLKDNGEVELIHFATVVDNGDGSITISTLLRGRRGTDTMAFSHTANEDVILVIDGDRKFFSLDLSYLDVLRYYKIGGQNQFISQVPTIELTSEGRPLMPYWPSQFDFSVDGSDNITITWVRRNRIFGDEVDGSDFVLLSEDSEEYELEILTGPGGTVVRTFTSILSASQAWTAAEQTTDGFNAPADVFTIRVYQVSGQVGRGFSREVTLGQFIPFAIAATDSVTIGEVVSVQFSLLEMGAAYAPIEDAVLISETVTLHVALAINVEDAVAVGEAIDLIRPITIIEDITMTEFVDVNLA